MSAKFSFKISLKEETQSSIYNNKKQGEGPHNINNKLEGWMPQQLIFKGFTGFATSLTHDRADAGIVI